MTRRSLTGRPRTLTDAQVATIMAWHSRIVAMKAERALVPTLRQLAKQLGVSRGAITNAIYQGGQLKQVSPELRSVRLKR